VSKLKGVWPGTDPLQFSNNSYENKGVPCLFMEFLR
jgi:hypothetical protein